MSGTVTIVLPDSVVLPEARNLCMFVPSGQFPCHERGNQAWWPAAESNCRYADFQYEGGAPGAPGSPRPGRDSLGADRTALFNRTDSEPLRPNSGPNRRGGPCRSRGCGGTDRTGTELSELRWPSLRAVSVRSDFGYSKPFICGSSVPAFERPGIPSAREA